VVRASSTWIAADLATAHPPLVRLAELMDSREHLATLPTPLHHAPRLSRTLRREAWLKRDDLTGVGLGGNKIRKMELLAALARAEGADTLVSVGAAQSNHARTVAMVAAIAKMNCHLILSGDEPAESSPPSGNLLLTDLVGAELHWTGTDSWDDLAQTAKEVTAALAREGRRVFWIPVGGSVPHGAAAFVAAYLELVGQLARAGLNASAVYCSSSSGGTQAGLHLGAVLARRVLAEELPAGAMPRVVGVDVAKIYDPLAASVEQLATDTAELLGVQEIWQQALDDGAAPEVVTGYLGEGYAIPSTGSQEALRRLARTEGVILDPVYTAKGFQAFCEAPGEDPIVFWHTGGSPALFAHP